MPVFDCSELSKWHLVIQQSVLFTSIGQMLFLAPTIDNADPLFALVTRPGFYLHHEEAQQVAVNK